MKRTFTYTIGQVVPYINWVYYFHAWGMEPRHATIANIHECPACRSAWLASFTAEERTKAQEAMQLYESALNLLHQWANEPRCHAIVCITRAYSDGDDIIIDDMRRIPFLRQQRPDKFGYTLCLSDYIAPKRHIIDENFDIANTMGIFATSVSQFSDTVIQVKGGSYSDLTLSFQHSILADRLAEATAEKLHEEVRKHYWGYAPEEKLNMCELHEERFQGIRPAVGYPSLPDQSINFIIDSILNLSDIGISLSENGAMRPHSTVSGFMFAHPKAQYFAIKDISEEQLIDYAQRRGFDINQAKKFLASIDKNKK